MVVKLTTLGSHVDRSLGRAIVVHVVIWRNRIVVSWLDLVQPIDLAVREVWIISFALTWEDVFGVPDLHLHQISWGLFLRNKLHVSEHTTVEKHTRDKSRANVLFLTIVHPLFFFWNRCQFGQWYSLFYRFLNDLGPG